MALLAINLVHMGSLKPFDYPAIHEHETPYPWNSIIYLPSSQIDWALMNNAYIPIIATISLFLFFGMTKDAINDYRGIALFFGLGRFFPRLYRVYDPDRRGPQGSSSTGSSNVFSGTS